MRKLVLMLVVVASMLVPARADAATVTFGVSAATWAPGTCSVDVAPQADGVAVLEAARAKGCILSYETDDSFGAPFLECVNFVCGYPSNPVTFWCLYFDGEPATTGLDGFSAGGDQELVASYQQFWVGTAPVGCF